MMSLMGRPPLLLEVKYRHAG